MVLCPIPQRRRGKDGRERERELPTPEEVDYNNNRMISIEEGGVTKPRSEKEERDREKTKQEERKTTHQKRRPETLM